MSETTDAFLGGRLTILQPKDGYRAATDPVFLAAACPARAGDSVLDLGCGVGVAALCLGARVHGLRLTGVEFQSAYAALARRNAVANKTDFEVIEADLRTLPDDFRARSFDHVVFNPPFFPAGSVVAPSGAGRAQAHVEVATLADFCDIALRRLRPGGTLTVIQRAERLGDILAELSLRTGDIRIRPIVARTGREAGRVLVRGTKTSKAPMRLLSPLVVHTGENTFLMAMTFRFRRAPF